jgi:succinate dehydrogenase / fumarate reductase, cytochrome b subunit
METNLVLRPFIWRRLHSLMGLWLVLFLLEHLVTNSQAALWLGEDGKGFIAMVNAVHNLPYLKIVETLLIGIPILLHMILGIKYALTSKNNAHKTDGKTPSLRKYGRNRAYYLQRITSWILLFGIVGHVINFRFLEYPYSVSQGDYTTYFARLDMDDGLYPLAYRLGVRLYDEKGVVKEGEVFAKRSDEKALLEAAKNVTTEKLSWKEGVIPTAFDLQKDIIVRSAQKYQLKEMWLQKLQEIPLGKDQVIAETVNFGTATLLTVRDVFKRPVYLALYTIFVLAACFHAFNGFWTFLLSWGLIIKRSAQKSLLVFSVGLIVFMSLLGLAAIWGTWFNLRN